MRSSAIGLTKQSKFIYEVSAKALKPGGRDFSDVLGNSDSHVFCDTGSTVGKIARLALARFASLSVQLYKCLASG